MRKIIILCTLVLFLSSSVFAGAVKKTKSEVTFKGFGTFASLQSEKISAEKKLTESKNDFKGKGLLGGLAGKTILRSGDLAEIIDLPAMTIYHLDNKRKEYTTTPIEKIKAPEEEQEENIPEEKSEEPESQIKIIRSEFKVEETGESKVINQFPCKKYEVTWLTEWEDLQTGGKGTDRLVSLVWTTPAAEAIKAAEDEEKEFSREYMKRIGLEEDFLARQILGTNWFSLLSGTGQGKAKLSPEETQFVQEMKKIKGYPIVIDGKYYAIREAKQATAGAEEEGQDVRKAMGKFALKALKKKPKASEAEEPSLAFYTEVIELAPTNINFSEFQVPPDYKKKG